jgi:hypothetical protein
MQMSWYIKGRRDAGPFQTKGEAIAAAWELTLPGGVRPEVYKVAKMTVMAREGSVRIAPSDRVEAGQAIAWAEDDEGRAAWKNIGWVDENGLHVEE